MHIFYGSASGAALQRRIEEIERLVAFFAKRQDKEFKDVKEATEEQGGRLGPTQVENYILLGDFNVISPQHETMKALASRGFDVPDAIDGDAVRREDDHYYDQIAVRVKDKRFEVAPVGFVDGDVLIAEDVLVWADNAAAGEMCLEHVDGATLGSWAAGLRIFATACLRWRR